MNRVLAWAVFFALAFGAYRFLAAFENPFSSAGAAPSALSLAIPGCAPGGCTGEEK